MKKKIIIALAVLILAIGVVSAVNINDFKFPDGFYPTQTVDNSYMDTGGHAYIIYDLNSSTQHYFLTNRTGYALEHYKDNIYFFADVESKLVGTIEVGTHNGNKYIILSAVPESMLDSESVNAYNYLIEFNQLNNINTVPI